MSRATDGLEIVAISASGCDPVTGVCHVEPADEAEAGDESTAADAPAPGSDERYRHLSRPTR